MTAAAREHLEARAKWQDEAAIRGMSAEEAFQEVMSRHVASVDSRVRISRRPRDLAAIYGVHSSGRSHGVLPDHAIHGPTGRTIYVEMKRQRAAGNAHERACKYFAPGIIRSGRVIAKQPKDVIPYWWIFTDGIAEDERYVREIMHWFRGIEAHVLLWQPREAERLTAHFDAYILPLVT